MCGRRQPQNIEVKVPTPVIPPAPPPAIAPIIPAQQVAAAPVSLRNRADVGVRPDRQRRQRERTAMRQGASQLRIPLNTGFGGTSGGLNA